MKQKLLFLLVISMGLMLAGCRDDEEGNKKDPENEFDMDYVISMPLSLEGRWKLVEEDGRGISTLQILNFNTDSTVLITSGYHDGKYSGEYNYSLTQYYDDKYILTVENGNMCWNHAVQKEDISFTIFVRGKGELSFTEFYGEGIYVFSAPNYTYKRLK